jgi:beta-xylosidase
MITKSILIISLLLGLIIGRGFSQSPSSVAGNGNPLLPGYFADPTIQKFGDTYYIYATTDGIKLASGEPQVWISKDFVNWYDYELKVPVPNGLNNCWAPDVFKAPDGKYYYYMGNCEWGCNIYGFVSDSPMGPFTPLNGGKAVIPAGTSKKDFPALDAQFLVDDDGSVYSFFGTWCTSFGGMGYVKIDPSNMYSILKTGQIPIAQVPKAFEAAYPIKRNGKYFLMYSAGDCRLSSYAVHYSVADSPEGPFKPGKNSPILVTSADGSIDGPGHHSILKDGENYYIVYHRHDNPHSTNGEFRQVCVDKLVFSDNETIEKVIPTHIGVGPLGTNQISAENLAYKAKAGASSYYHLVSKKTAYSTSDYDYRYLPENATDNNNGTMWKAASGDMPQSLVVDLGKTVNVKRVMTQFEYPTFYYQYKIEVSGDSTNWTLFSDKTNNRRSGSPMTDDNDLSARYVKLTVTGTEKSGMIAAVWNIKVYDSTFEIPSFQNAEMTTAPGIPASKSLLADFKVDSLSFGKTISSVKNKGTLGGSFDKIGNPVVAWVDSVKAAQFDGRSYLKLSVKAPASLNWNSAFTASAWVYNPAVGNGECLMVWNSRDNMLQSSYAAMMYGTGGFGAAAHGDGAVDMPYKGIPSAGKWHHILLTFDGMLENIYVDGKLNNQLPISLFVESGDILIGASGEPSENYTGYIANAQLFDKAMTQEEVITLMNATKPKKVTNANTTSSSEGLKNSKNLFRVSSYPGSNSISVSSSGDDNGKMVNLVAMDGRVVSSGKFNDSSNIELSVLNKGIYILVMKNSNSTYSQKFAIY